MMNATTRDVLAETMTREWSMVWGGVPGMRPEAYEISGSAADVVADFRRRYPFLPVSAEKLVMDEGDWTIRVTLADHAVVTLFSA